MENHEMVEREENEYLKKTVDFLKSEIERGDEVLLNRKRKLISSRKEMWEDSVHFTNDFEKLTEVNQHLSEVSSQTGSYVNTFKMLEYYRGMIANPYFGRIDFVEDGFSDTERIYIGLHGVMNSQTYEILVHDWRSPVASMFYQYELGRASYKISKGSIAGELKLKRQYKIDNSRLKYFFDCSVRITDDMLQQALSYNASEKMKNIVVTIQKEQDIIIRDTENELLIVQGAAGSGKTSIALHRIAFLLYQGSNQGLSSNNVLIISPSSIFSNYISSVLPELGEENVEEITFDEIADNQFNHRFQLESKSTQLETIITASSNKEANIRDQVIEFKGSMALVNIIERFIQYYERRMIPIEDVYYNGKIIETKQEIKSALLNNSINMPMAKRLKKIEAKLLEKLHPLQKEICEKLEQIVANESIHQFEIKPYSRLLSIKKTKILVGKIREFTEIDYYKLYKELFTNETLFLKLSKGLDLPMNMKEILLNSKYEIEKNNIHFEDYAPLLYLKLCIEGTNPFSQIRQVVVDEAQDYCPMQYEVFKMLFKDAGYTVLGDLNQTVNSDVDVSLYDIIDKILDKRKSAKLFLNKSYRSSYEISRFNQRLIDMGSDVIAFERHEEEPEVIFKESIEQIDSSIVDRIVSFLKQGYESIAIICKTQKEAVNTYERLKKLIDIKFINTGEEEIPKGIFVISSYMSKGLEFDAVIIYDVSRENYSDKLDKRLLYIASSRALHRLIIYYTGEKSLFI